MVCDCRNAFGVSQSLPASVGPFEHLYTVGARGLELIKVLLKVEVEYEHCNYDTECLL